MEKDQLHRLLVDTARGIGIEIVEDRLNRRGGTCMLDGKTYVIYDVHAPITERNQLLVKAISSLDLKDLYLPPRVRDIIRKTEE